MDVEATEDLKLHLVTLVGGQLRRPICRSAYSYDLQD